MKVQSVEGGYARFPVQDQDHAFTSRDGVIKRLKYTSSRECRTLRLLRLQSINAKIERENLKGYPSQTSQGEGEES